MEDKIKEMLDRYTELFNETLKRNFKEQEESINKKLDLHKADTEKLFVENFNKQAQNDEVEEQPKELETNEELEDF